MEVVAMSEQHSGLGFPVVDPANVSPRFGSARYPEALRAPFAARGKRALGDALGLQNFGVNLVHMPAGSESALRHWHTREDEFVMVLEGELTLVTNAGETILGPGMAAGFPAGKADGHCLVNRSSRDAVYLEVGDRRPGDEVTYPDADLAAIWRDGARLFVRKDGRPY
jgi:uncharacterized cupin superfamily protein